MLRIPAERPVNQQVGDILTLLADVLRAEGADHFVVGATARDLLFFHVFGVRPGRMTRDVDFAVALKDWDQFERIKALLLNTGRFEAVPGVAQRLYFDPQISELASPVDLLPFGPIAPETTIAWPPDGNVVMNVAGYAEAFQASIDIEVRPGLIAKVASIPSLACLKLMAWNDRGLVNKKDAQDLFFLLDNYATAGNLDRLYEQAFNLLEKCNFDTQHAGAVLLGVDCRAVMSESVVTSVRAILADPVLLDRLVLHMAGTALDPDQRAAALVRCFDSGFAMDPDATLLTRPHD